MLVVWGSRVDDEVRYVSLKIPKRLVEQEEDVSVE